MVAVLPPDDGSRAAQDGLRVQPRSRRGRPDGRRGRHHRPGAVRGSGPGGGCGVPDGPPGRRALAAGGSSGRCAGAGGSDARGDPGRSHRGLRGRDGEHRSSRRGPGSDPLRAPARGLFSRGDLPGLDRRGGRAMIRLVGVELYKLVTTRMFFWLLATATGLVVVVTALHFILAGDNSLVIEGAAGSIVTEADLHAVLDVSSVAVIFTLILGATAVSGEHRHNTIASTYLVTPKRSRVTLAKTIGFGVAGLALGIVVQMASLVVAIGWLAASGSAIPFGVTVLTGVLMAPVATGLAASLGVGIGALIPNQLGAVLAAVGWVMVVEQLFSGLFPEVAGWLPVSGGAAAIAGGHEGLTPAGGVALLLARVVAAGVVGIVAAPRPAVAWG